MNEYYIDGLFPTSYKAHISSIKNILQEYIHTILYLWFRAS